MRQIITTIITIFTLTVFGQKVKEMNPTLGVLVDKSAEGEIEFIKKKEICDSLWRGAANCIEITGEGDEDFIFINNEECKALKRKISNNNCRYSNDDYWGIPAYGLSRGWYCTGDYYTTSTSSELKPSSEEINYSSDNACDHSYKTAWIEGVPGYGIGEYLVYDFTPETRETRIITKIIVVNGYIKSEKIWRENSRVKKLKMYLDAKPFVILNLADSRREQTFSFDTISYGNRGAWEELVVKPWLKMKFEIMDVYKGEKYDDAAITEIYFNDDKPIHCYCFSAGTKILMSDKTEKNIELIKEGDTIFTFNTQTNQFLRTQVTQLIKARHSNLIKLTFEDREIIVTDDHPFYVNSKQWASINPYKSNSLYNQAKTVIKLFAGDSVFIPIDNKYVRLKNIQQVNEEQLTYTIEPGSGDNFIANGLLVKSEQTFNTKEKTSANIKFPQVAR